MLLSQSEIAEIAHLARLQLTEDELTLFQAQLSAFFEFASVLDELDLEGVPPSPHAVSQINVLRDDIIEPSLPIDEVLFNAFATLNDQFLIQSVLDK